MNEFCCEQVASEVAREEAQSGLSCQTGEQFWQESFESVRVYTRHNGVHLNRTELA